MTTRYSSIINKEKHDFIINFNVKWNSILINNLKFNYYKFQDFQINYLIDRNFQISYFIVDSEELGRDVPVKIVDPFLSQNIAIPSELPYRDKCGKRVTPPKNTDVPKRAKRFRFAKNTWNYFAYRRRHRNQTTMSRLRSLNANRGDKTVYPSGMGPTRSRNFSESIDTIYYIEQSKNNTLSSISTTSTTFNSTQNLREVVDTTQNKKLLRVPSKSANKLQSSFDHNQDITKTVRTSSQLPITKSNIEEKTRRHSSNVNPAIMINGAKPTMSIQEEDEQRVRRHSSAGQMLHNISHPISYV